MQEPNAVQDFLGNTTLWTAIFAMALAQCLKVLIEYWRTRSWKTALFLSPGGMPSSHSALASALMGSVGLRFGFGTPLFAISAVITLVVMYDAAGVRRAAGNQAKAINFLFSKLEHQGVKLDKNLKEILGHSPTEVAAGALLGIIVAAAAYTIFQ